MKGFGFPRISYQPDERDCPECGGTGYDPNDGGQCDTCAGTGTVDR